MCCLPCKSCSIPPTSSGSSFLPDRVGDIQCLTSSGHLLSKQSLLFLLERSAAFVLYLEMQDNSPDSVVQSSSLQYCSDYGLIFQALNKKKKCFDYIYLLFNFCMQHVLKNCPIYICLVTKCSTAHQKQVQNRTVQHSSVQCRGLLTFDLFRQF